MARDYGICVASTFDLRYLALLTNCRAGGLGKMSEDYLNVKLDKNWRIRCSDWESPTLNNKQLDYAAKDAHVGIELFRFFADRLKPKGFFDKPSNYVQYIIDEYCFRYIDLNFSSQVVAQDNQKSKKSSNESSSM